MTGPGVSDDDMPSFRRSARRDESPLTDESLAALLSGALPPEDVPPDLRPAADVLAALRTGPGRDELADEASALAEFRIRGPRHRGTRLGPASQPRHPRLFRLPSLSAKIATATAVIAVAVGGVAAAAVVGVLPAPVQRAIHDVIPVVRVRGGKHHTTSSGRADHGSGSAAQCAGRSRRQADSSAARRSGQAAGHCARHRHQAITHRHGQPRRIGRCPSDPSARWSAHPQPFWTPTVGPTRWPAWDSPRCGRHWPWRRWQRWQRWLRWHRRHLREPGRPHSPAPSPAPTPRHHHDPQPGHDPAPQPSSQPTARHTGQPAPGHTSKSTRHHSPVRT